MRDYKFRGKRKDNKEWVYGYYTYSQQNGVARIWVNEPKWPDSTVLYDYVVDPETVGQFTGLKDKNGREGYQKDIWLYHGVRYTVEWDEENAGFYLKHPSDRATIDDHIPISEFPNGEVIGNVWDHPHLLKGGDPT